MRYAVVENNVVVNVIDAPEGWTITGKTLVASDTADKRDTWAPDGVVLEGTEVFFVPEETPDPPVAPAVQYAALTSDTDRILFISRHIGLHIDSE